MRYKWVWPTVYAVLVLWGWGAMLTQIYFSHLFYEWIDTTPLILLEDNAFLLFPFIHHTDQNQALKTWHIFSCRAKILPENNSANHYTSPRWYRPIAPGDCVDRQVNIIWFTIFLVALILIKKTSLWRSQLDVYGSAEGPREVFKNSLCIS